MSRARNWVLVLVLTAGILASCAQPNVDPAPVNPTKSGRILLWHTWTGADQAVLEAMISNYTTINPGAEVISVAVDAAGLVDSFRTRSSSGLGPDLVLTDTATLLDLAEPG